MSVSVETSSEIDPRCSSLIRWQREHLNQNGHSTLPHIRDGLTILSGNGNRPLAEKIGHLIGIQPQYPVSRFPNGEVKIDIAESIRGQDAIIINSTGSVDVNSLLMEFVIMGRAAQRAFTEKRIGVIPTPPYGRDDKQNDRRGAIVGGLVIEMMNVAGFTQMMSVDMHNPTLQAVFPFGWDDFHGSFPMFKVLPEYLKKECSVMVAADEGRAKATRKWTEILGWDNFALICKFRPGGDTGRPKVTHMVGDVSGCHALLGDDMVDTMGTVQADANHLIKKGAKSVTVLATSALLSHPDGNESIAKRLLEAPVVKYVFTDAARLPTELTNDSTKADIERAEAIERLIREGRLEIASVAEMLAEGLIRTHTKQSLSGLLG